MITPEQCFIKFGNPSITQSFMTLWDVPVELEIGVIPKKIYCHKLMVESLNSAFKSLIKTGLVKELKTWDGCFNIRLQRGSKTNMSIHSWGLAIDLNAFENQIGATPKLSKEFVKCFTDAGFDWGGLWQRKDGMHFQLSKI